jgi:FkbM family methyltransferase
MGLQKYINLFKWIIYTRSYVPRIQEHLGLRKGDVVVQFRDGLKILVTLGKFDTTEVSLNFFTNQYFPKGLDIRSFRTIIDLGANIGTFSLFCAKSIPHAEIYSYEPFPSNFKKLKYNIDINNYQKRIHPFQFAVTDKKGELELHLSERGDDDHSLHKIPNYNYEKGHKITVKCTTLKDIMESNKIVSCDLLKLDIERAEYEVLFSTPKILFDKIRRISLEVHEDKRYSRQDLMKFLQKMGFKTKNLEGNLLYAYK